MDLSEYWIFILFGIFTFVAVIMAYEQGKKDGEKKD